MKSVKVTETYSRTKNSKKNIIVSFLLMTLTYLFHFVSRSLIVAFLGDKYLGLSSLFSSVLGILNMAEMGFSTAIVYNMYKPLAVGDDQTVCALLAFYKRTYRIIGCIVLGCGIVLIPFIPYLIKGSYPNNINIYLLFFIYVVDTSITYFLFAYKSSLLNALQRMDIAKWVNIVVCLFQYSAQVIALVVFHNYYIFVLAKVLGSALNNIVSGYMADRYYPQYFAAGSLSKEVKGEIIVRVKGLMVSKICGMSSSTFDSIILSAMIGLTAVAIYGNYLSIFTAVAALIALITNGMQASIGNSIATESLDKNHKDLFMWQFCFSVIATWCATFMMCLYQPVMEIWMGKDMLLDIPDVILICLWFAISTFSNPVSLYLTGNGMWWNIRIPSILSTVVNIILNIVLGIYFGVTGILFASLFSSFVFGLIWNTIIVFKDYYHCSPKRYFGKQLIYSCFAVITSASTYFLCAVFTSPSGFKSLIARGMICLFVPPIIMYLLLFRTAESKSAKELLLRVLKIRN